MSNRSPATEYFERAVEFVGEDWLQDQDEYYQRHHTQNPTPELISQYHRGLRDLGYVDDEFEEYFPGTTMNTLELVNVGRYLDILDREATVIDAETYDVIDTNLQERFAQRLRNPDEYFNTLYELRTAAIYASEGYTPQFIQETDFKTPDILLRTPFKVFVECKQVSQFSDRGHKQNAINKLLIQKTINHLHSDHAVIFKYDKQPARDVVEKIYGYLPRKITRVQKQVDVPFGSAVIYNLQKVYEDTLWVVDQRQDVRASQTEMYNTYLRPLVQQVSDQDLDFGDMIANTRYRPSETPSREGFVDIQFACIILDTERNYVSRTVNQLDKASSKFDEGSPNILHIDLPCSLEMADKFSGELRTAIGRRLNIKPKISAVTITLTHKERNNKGAKAIRQKGAFIENLDPDTSLPNKFSPLGNDLT